MNTDIVLISLVTLEMTVSVHKSSMNLVTVAVQYMSNTIGALLVSVISSEAQQMFPFLSISCQRHCVLL